jgi:hypothetical protein
MKAFRKWIFLGAVAVLAGVVGTYSANAGQQESYRAFSSWQGRGDVMRTGPNEATFIGIVTGRFDVDTDQGPVDAGDLTCPLVLIVNLDANTQKGTGRCVLATQGDDRIFMNMTCEGVPLVGCAGESVVTGGAGQFANATGGGHFVVRSSTHELTKSDLTLSDFATGIMFWPKLEYKAP